MIRLEPVNEKTFFPVVRMKLSPEQSQFVASNVMSLAQAWLYYDAARPFAVLNETGEVVGFIMLDWDENERTAGIWRFMIAEEHQGKGYGKAALSEAVRLIRESGRFDMAHLSYVPGNEKAQNLYRSVGFVETGELDGDEVVMRLVLTDDPKLGFRVPNDDEELEDMLTFLENQRQKGVSIPAALLKDALAKAVDERKALRLTILGETVGVYCEGELLLADEHKHRLDEAQRIIQNFTNV